MQDLLASHLDPHDADLVALTASLSACIACAAACTACADVCLDEDAVADVRQCIRSDLDCASKAFVHSFAEGVRVELKDTGVTVTSLMPGPTDTEFFSRADMEDTKIGRTEDKDDTREVARDGYDALIAGKASVVAGSFRNRLEAEVGTHLPDALAAPILARMTKPQD